MSINSISSSNSPSESIRSTLTSSETKGVSAINNEKMEATPSYYTNLSTLMDKNSKTHTAKPIEEQLSHYENETVKFRAEPLRIARSSLQTIKKELSKIQGDISKNKPGMMGKDWDFTLKDGKIETTSLSLSDHDKKWLEDKLNSNMKLVDAVKKYYGAVVIAYENTAEHTSPIAQTSDANIKNMYAIDVAKQINGNLKIVEVMKNSYGKYSNPDKAIDDVEKILVKTDQPRFTYENTRLIE